MLKAALVSLLMFSLGVSADESREAKVYELLQAQGIQATFDGYPDFPVDGNR